MELAKIRAMRTALWILLIFLNVFGTFGAAFADSTPIKRRAFLQLFGAAAASTVLKAPPLDILTETSMETVATNSSIPWGWVNDTGMDTSVFQCEGWCIYHPEDRIQIHNVNRKILDGFTRQKGLSDAERRTLDSAIERIDGLISFENQRLKDFAANQKNLENQTENSPGSMDHRLIDLVSRHLPVDRLNRLFWQISYPEEEILLTEDYQKLSELFSRMQGLESSLPLKSFLDQKQCHDLISN